MPLQPQVAPSIGGGQGSAPGVSAPSGTASVSAPAPSAQAVATAEAITGPRPPGTNTTPSSSEAISSISTANTVSVVDGDALAGIIGLDPSGSVADVNTPFGNISVTTGKVVGLAQNAALNMASSLLGLTSFPNPVMGLMGVSNPVTAAVAIASNIANHQSQPGTAVAQAKSGVPGTANSGVDPVSGFSIHSHPMMGILGLTGIQAMSVYNMNDPSAAPMSPIAAMRGPMALAHNADLTGMNDAAVMASFQSDSNGNIAYSGPIGMATSEGFYRSDGTFMSKYGLSDTGTANSFSQLSDVQQGLVALSRKSSTFSVIPSMLSDDAASFVATVEAHMESTNETDSVIAIQNLAKLDTLPAEMQAMVQEAANKTKTDKTIKDITNSLIAGIGAESVGAVDTMGMGPESGKVGKVDPKPADLTSQEGIQADQNFQIQKEEAKLQARLDDAAKKAKAMRDMKPRTITKDFISETQLTNDEALTALRRANEAMAEAEAATTEGKLASIEAQMSKYGIIGKPGSSVTTGPAADSATGQQSTTAPGLAAMGQQGNTAGDGGGDGGGDGAGDGTGPTGAAAASGQASAAVGHPSVSGPSPIGATCFNAGTLVTMADGTKKKIEDIKIGETLLGQDNSHNKVIKYDHPMLDKRQLISINNSRPFMTPEHPIYTKDGWKSYRLSDTIRENPAMKDEMAGEFKVGDEILNANGEWIKIKTIEAFDNEPQQQLYNFMLNGNNTYYANGFLVHNKGIICTELKRQGLVSTEIWKDMVRSGGLFPQVVLDGYHLWARPVVRRMKKSKSFSHKIETLARPVVYQIAAFNGGCGKWSVTGLSTLAVALPICAILGAAMLPFKQKNTNLILGDK